jgi:pyruvate dehydrogenase E2 component (dihydrolipoamide acetyltransferase)
MAFEFKLPDIGEGLVHGEIVKWLVNEGDTVAEDQPLVEVLTDKANVVIPSPRPGKVVRFGGKEGEVINVGALLCVIDDSGGGATHPAKGEAKHPTAVAEHPSADQTLFTVPKEMPGSQYLTGAQAAQKPAGRVVATPAIRKLARELKVDIEVVRGSGAGGRVTEEDVRGHASGAKSSPPAHVPAHAPAHVTAHAPAVPTAPAKAQPAHVPPGSEQRIPIKGVRRVIAEHMRRSKTTAAHFTYVEEIDVTELVRLQDGAKKHAADKGVKLTYLPFIIKKLIPAMKKHPTINATVDDEKGELVVKAYYNFGIATMTDQGLMVPVVKNCESKSILEIAKEVQRLSDLARAGRIPLEDLKGGTFTITSPGKLGGLLATPIINYPEVAILGVHKIEKRPVVIEDKIVVRDMMNVSISLDHRVIDGLTAAEFIAEFKRYLESPQLLFMEMV